MFQASGGYLISAFVSPQNTVWVCGSNQCNQLGISDEDLAVDDEDEPQILQCIKTLVDITQISAGYAHSLCLDSNGNVFSFGDNPNGQLGHDKKQISPAMIENLPKIKSVCAGNHSLCLDEDGFMWGFGKNSTYECYPIFERKRSLEDIRTPKRIYILPDIKLIRCGYSHSVCSDNNGKVWAFGNNIKGQLGTTKLVGKVSLREITDIGICSQISAGFNHTTVLNTKNECFVFGSNSQGQLGIGVGNDVKIPTKLNYDVEFIYCGYFHTFIRTVDGSCFISGNNNYGQLGLGHSNCVNTFTELPEKNMDVVLMGGLHTIYVTEERRYLCCGWNAYLQCCLEDVATVTELTEIPHKNLACVLTFQRAKSARK